MIPELKFDPAKHQKVRYDGQLYVVIFDEFPDYFLGDDALEVVLHPVCNDRIVHITSDTVRKFLTVKKGSAREESSDTAV
jgi:hypothetical protein